MDDSRKTREERLQELQELRQQIATLKASLDARQKEGVVEGKQWDQFPAESSAGELPKPEEAIRDSASRFHAVFRAAPVGMALVDLEGRIATANRAMETIFGYAPGELSGVSILNMSDLDDRETMQQALRTLVAGKKDQYDSEQSYRRKDNETVWVRSAVSLVRDDHGAPHFLIATAANITRQKHVDDALREERHMLRQLLELQEHDRRMIGYEIHDGFAQYLAGALFLFQAYEHLVGEDASEAAKTFEDAMKLLNQSMKETRRLVSGLRPLVLDESGIVAGIRYLLEEVQQRGEMAIEFVNDLAADRMPPLIENAIFRIVQEGLNNAGRHSQSPRVRVGLKQHEMGLRLEIQDWGVGFDPEKVSAGHYGLEGIRERSRLLGGRATIRSAAGQGTLIVVEIPTVS